MCDAGNGAFLSRRMMLAGASVGTVAAMATTSFAQSPSSHSYSPTEGDVTFPPGLHRIDADRVVAGNLRLDPGARLDIAPGITLTLHGDLVASTSAVFLGEGRVDMTRSRIIAARPEWWGAVVDAPAVDCRPALTACLNAHLWMMLGQGTYHIADTWVIDRPNRRVWGMGRTKDAGGTRIVLMRGGLGTVVRVGTEHAPPVLNDYLAGVDIRWIELGRTQSALSGKQDPGIGLSIRHVLDCRFEALLANEHAIGFSLRGAVRCYVVDCRVFRSLSDPGGRDTFVGFDLDGRKPPIPTGANASLYILDCNVRLGGAPRLASAIGLRMAGAISDTFLVRFETTTVSTGILIDGGTGKPGYPGGRFSQIDVQCVAPVLDGCDAVGIDISGLDETAMVEITSPYVALAPGGRTAIAMADGAGVRVAGGQLVGSLSSPAVGIALDRVSRPGVDGTSLLGFSIPLRASNVSGLDVTFLCLADSTSHGPAVVLANCRQGYLRPRLAGKPEAHSAGVEVDKDCRALSIETVGIDPTVLLPGHTAVVMDGQGVAPVASTTMVSVAPEQ